MSLRIISRLSFYPIILPGEAKHVAVVYHQVMRILAAILLLTFTPNALVDFAFNRWKSEPQIEIEDAYKWIFHATRGGEHAVPNEDMARRWLEREWQTLGAPEANESVWEPLRADGAIGRLHLRPYRARGGKPDDLLKAFVESSRSFNEDEANFRQAWRDLGERLKSKAHGKLTWQEWKRLDEKMRAADFPAIHHSQAYEQARRPAYRVLTGERARTLMANLK